MADKTTTLKTKTNDNVYPNVIGDNRKNAFVDSSTITHHFYDKTHKVGFQINNETNIKIQNSLQKPAGLTKTKLVGVGTNGQENIEIGDNLTLANGKLSASGGGDSKKIGTIELNTTQTEAYLTNSDTFSLTDIQLDVIRNNDIIHIVFINEGLQQIDEYYKQIKYIIADGTKYNFYYLYNFYGSLSGIKTIYIQDISFDMFFGINTLEQLDPISTYVEKMSLRTVENSITKEKSYELSYQQHDNNVSSPILWGISTINGVPVIEKYNRDSKYHNYTFTEDKTISLFGKYSILVPKDSADTNILPLPSDASTSTYVLKAVNGTVQWVKES